MARKVFISFLGTGNYVNCKYHLPSNNISEPVRFIQEALIKDICTDWTNNDKILIFCTEEARKKNWLDNGHVDPNKPYIQLEDIEKIGLQHRLSETTWNEITEMISIKDGFSEDEIWEIFDCIYRRINNNDELYFDVTHAFRSIPMFSTILFNFANYMKGIDIKSIHYGAFEKLGPAYKVKQEIPLENRIAPVLNLTNMIRLQEYTDIASSFTSYGRTKKLSDALKNENNESNAVIKEVYTALENFDNAIIANRIADIEKGQYMLVLNNTSKAINKQNIPTPIKDIIIKLRKQLTDFGFVPKKSNQNIEAAISWAKNYKMLPQAYTMGQEYIITLISTHFAEKSPFGKDKNAKKDFRTYISSICSMSEEDVNQQVFKGILAGKDEINNVFLKELLISEIRPSYAKLGEKRNAINHAKGNVDYYTLVSEFDSLYESCLKIIKQYT